jgi:hypothetical protein
LTVMLTKNRATLARCVASLQRRTVKPGRHTSFARSGLVLGMPKCFATPRIMGGVIDGRRQRGLDKNFQTDLCTR